MSIQPPAASSERALPLFKRGQEHDDEPLIKMPAAPRPPLAVRRTPDTPRLRAVPRPIPRPGSSPALQFPDEGVERPTVPHEQKSAPVRPVASPPLAVEAPASAAESIRPVARVAAALI